MVYLMTTLTFTPLLCSFVGCRIPTPMSRKCCDHCNTLQWPLDSPEVSLPHLLPRERPPVVSVSGFLGLPGRWPRCRPAGSLPHIIPACGSTAVMLIPKRSCCLWCGSPRWTHRGRKSTKPQIHRSIVPSRPGSVSADVQLKQVWHSRNENSL